MVKNTSAKGTWKKVIILLLIVTSISAALILGNLRDSNISAEGKIAPQPVSKVACLDVIEPTPIAEQEIKPIKEVSQPVDEPKKVTVAEPPYSGVEAKPPVEIAKPLTLAAPEPVQNDPRDFSNIDFEGKRAKNQEFYCWLRIPGLGIEMPVVSDDIYADNVYYLSHDYNGNYNANGWVFTHRDVDEVQYNFNTIFYGHNTDSEHFGRLIELLNTGVQGKEGITKIYAASSPTPNFIPEYQIVSVCILDKDDFLYFTGSKGYVSDEERQWYIDRIKAENLVPRFSVDEMKISDRFIMMSTCYDPGGRSARLVVFAKSVR